MREHLEGDADNGPAAFVRSDEADGVPVLIARGEIDVYTSARLPS